MNMQNRKLRIGPTTIANAAANIYNTPTTTGGVGVPSNVTATYTLLSHVRVVNRTGSPVNVSLFIGGTGASAAGTEYLWSATPVPANGFLEAYPGTRLDSGDFLTGVAGSASALTFEADGEIGVAG
jgi:hypothetical protein